MSGNTVPSAHLASALVRTAEGEVVGRVRDVFCTDASGDLAAVTVARGRIRTRQVLLPAADVELVRTSEDRDGIELRLRIPRSALDCAAVPPETGHVSRQELVEAARAVGIEEPATL